MSENLLRLIPTNPLYVPSSDAQNQARTLLASLLPEGEINLTVTEEISFIDQGSNFERVLCPCCGAVVPMEWWSQEMDRAYGASQFQDLSIMLPCCQTPSSLNDLDYDWPAGFAQFLLEARSPGGDLTPEQVSLVASLLGCSVHKIWAHD
ncbi:MAG TPA: hypothetical protein VH593_23775 [Ktedonobacteraceae bacterium]|jgi:hypothetical protein